MIAILHFDFSTIISFAFLRLELAFRKFSTLLLISFDPKAQFRSKFFQTVSNKKTHPPKIFLSLQIVAVMHHEPKNSDFRASKRGQKLVWWTPFCKIFKNYFEIFHTEQKKSSHAIAGDSNSTNKF